MDEAERRRRQDAVVARVQRVEEEQDFGPALEPAALTEAALLREDAEDVDSRFILGWLHLYRYGGDPGNRAELDLAVEMFLPCLFSDIDPADLPEEIMPRLIDEATDAVTAMSAALGESAEVGDLDDLCWRWERILELVPDDDVHRPGYITNLGTSLMARFARTGAFADLEQAIDCFRASLVSDTDSAGRAVTLSNLGNALGDRYEWTTDSADLEEAVTASRAAVEAAPQHDRQRATYMANLGSTLASRFERTQNLADADEAITWLHRTLAAPTLDDVLRVRGLSNLGLLLGQRYQVTQDESDLEAAATALREGLASAGEHPDRASMLTSLGGSLMVRFTASGRREYVDEAVSLYREAVKTVPREHPSRTRYLGALAAGLARRASLGGTGAGGDDAEAAALFRQAVDNSATSVSQRLSVAAAAGILIGGRRPASAANFMDYAVRLLPQAVPRALQRSDQQFTLGLYGGVAGAAAALALRDPDRPAAERPGSALRLLETGRGVLFAQALETRDDVTDLREQDPAAAARFVWLRNQLDKDLQPAERRELAAQWDTLLAEVRERPGMSAFARPPALTDLLAESVHGPIVTFNNSEFGADALLLTTDAVRSVPLPGLVHGEVIARVEAFDRALHTTAHSPDREARRSAQRELTEILGWLWEEATGPVLAALGYDKPQHPDTPPAAWPRLWWAPGGLLGMLPLHASGYHDGSGAAVLDRVVSSYTPTIGALRYARRPRRSPPDTALIVAMPRTPDVPGRLAFVPEEARIVGRHIPAAVEPATPTTADVLRRLPEHAVVHFACHGISDPANPSRSRLLLHDHATSPLTVASLAAVHLENAQLAYLSACETARIGDLDLADEFIHLTSAFQLAGYPHVVGTLWPVDDYAATRVAEHFYATYARLGPAHTAQALHHAVRAVRSAAPAAPSLWAAHLHAGA
jgi:tetratricopeptide (TPR) repeat protein